MRYLHTMLRVRNLDAALDFYCNKLGLQETRRRVDEKNRYTLVFLAAPADADAVEASRKTGREAPTVELTYNWDLGGFQKVRLQPGETREVTFRITLQDLKFYNSKLEYDWEPGEFIIRIGGDSSQLRSTTVHWSKPAAPMKSRRASHLIVDQQVNT